MAVLIRRAETIRINRDNIDKPILRHIQDARVRATMKLDLTRVRDPRRADKPGLKRGTRQKDFEKELQAAAVQAEQAREETLEKLNERLEEAHEKLQSKLLNLKPILPLLLSLKGKPFHIDDHFPFEPFYSTLMALKMCFKCGRQVSKSTNLAAQGVIQSACIPFFNTLYVTPLFEMIRRFSSNYVREFIEFSPVKRLFVDSNCNNNVLQRSFINQSKMFFSFAFLNADRTRGLNNSKVAYDEVQDLDRQFMPIIRESMSGSQWKLEQMTGTPKTTDGTLENIWVDSSQAEWVTKCTACNYWNIPALDYDLEKMLGPSHVEREISERYPGVVCAGCSRPIYPRTGHWVHANPDLRYEFAGYHVPQIIMPMHFANPKAWGILLGKRQGFDRTPLNVFFNEVCGESYDTGAKLITATDLRAAATLHENRIEDAVKTISNYVHRVLSVDWGGGGEDQISFTAMAVCGMKANGDIDVLYGWRSMNAHDHTEEARQVLILLKKFKCSHLVHDYNGAGTVRETLVINTGFPKHRIIPMVYQRTAVGSLMKPVAESPKTGQRFYYRLDKARSLNMTAKLIQLGHLHFFKYDYKGSGQPGLLHDFLSLTEDYVDSRFGAKIYTIIRNEKSGPDDFATAVNMGACALFYKAGFWPNLAEMASINQDPELLQALTPKMRWEDFEN